MLYKLLEVENKFPQISNITLGPPPFLNVGGDVSIDSFHFCCQSKRTNNHVLHEKCNTHTNSPINVDAVADFLICKCGLVTQICCLLSFFFIVLPQLIISKLKVLSALFISCLLGHGSELPEVITLCCSPHAMWLHYILDYTLLWRRWRCIFLFYDGFLLIQYHCLRKIVGQANSPRFLILRDCLQNSMLNEI